MPHKRSPVAEALAAVGNVCEATGTEWYLFGAQAALVYGSPRLTADIDITVRLKGSTAELAEAFTNRGFELRIKDPAFVETTRVLPAVHVATGLPIDVVLAGPGLEDLFFSRAKPRDVGGVRVPVASVEDMVVMKILSGRPKDIGDVEAMLRAQENRIDLGVARETLGLLEEALGQSDLLPTLERLLGNG